MTQGITVLRDKWLNDLANILLDKNIKLYKARLSQNNLQKVVVEAFAKIYVPQNNLKETFVDM
jgi:hypothetical protein